MRLFLAITGALCLLAFQGAVLYGVYQPKEAAPGGKCVYTGEAPELGMLPPRETREDRRASPRVRKQQVKRPQRTEGG